ncbi:hypothetical protein [Nonomuraea sp. SBT364]|uniref:hypothetical protein n=1 Tax=Nonomuraea sp. SBT364 TaxID=1580530 RepID=UPI001E5F20CE|nr:hypothetical protein [Nonomuraea sp. SBT364]
MRTSPRKIAAAAVIAVAGGLVLPASAAHAVVDPTTLSSVQSITRLDPVLMANCATGSVADPVGAVAVPPEVPLVGCLTL